MNDVTAGGITSVTKPGEEWRSVVRERRSVTSPIHEVEDLIAYARDKRVGLSVINQFAFTKRQPGNYRPLRFIANYETIHRRDSRRERERGQGPPVESRPRPSSATKGRYSRAKMPRF